MKSKYVTVTIISCLLSGCMYLPVDKKKVQENIELEDKINQKIINVMDKFIR